MLDPVLNKKDSIEHCIQQIRCDYSLPSDKTFADDHLKQDAIAANLQRFCQLGIDLTNLMVRKKKLGLPKESAESFALLADAGIIDNAMVKKLKAMVGFRNVLAYQYREMNLDLMVEIIERHLDELIDFAQRIVETFNRMK